MRVKISFIYTCVTRVEGHDVEKTGMSVDEMVSKEGKKSDGYLRTPLQMAAEKDQFEIVQYLVKSCTKVDLIGQTNSYGSNSLHYAARYSKKNVQMLQFLIDNYKETSKQSSIRSVMDWLTPLDLAFTMVYSSPIKKDIVRTAA